MEHARLYVPAQNLKWKNGNVLLGVVHAERLFGDTFDAFHVDRRAVVQILNILHLSWPESGSKPRQVSAS